MVNGQGFPVHLKLYNNRNFQIDGASRCFGIWVWQLVHLLILVCSFQRCVLFLCLAKLCRSRSIRDKGLLNRRNHSLPITRTIHLLVSWKEKQMKAIMLSLCVNNPNTLLVSWKRFPAYWAALVYFYTNAINTKNLALCQRLWFTVELA